ncbi:MAG: fumarylacetoacetate hydrolase family protein [Chitinophagaceae bacterium]
MKLCRYGNEGHELPAVCIDATRYDVSDFGQDYNEFFFAGTGIADLETWFADNKETCKVIDPMVRWASCIARPSKIVCIGLNYADHAAESNMTIPKEPIVFFKSTSSLVGPNDNLVIPKNSEKTDWEVELAVVIGKKASYVEEANAMQHVAGFALHNDYSERAFQLERGGQWVKGKSCDSFAPLGPWMATSDEITDVNNLRLWLTVNGNKYQDGNTRNFIFNVAHVVSYLSQFMTLLPGDVISTGTPAGVGLGIKPLPVYLKPGDVVELGIDGLGTSRQVAVAY